MTTTTTKDALYFVTEQACCLRLVQSEETDDFRACREAAHYLAGGDLKGFDERTNAVKHNPTQDYNTEQYEGKSADVRHAVAELARLGQSADTPADKCDPLMKVAEIIAAFYGMDEAESA
jgi:hypothetical protein